jgi:hypothetical protein
MGTPAMLFGTIARGFMVGLTAFWVTSFLVIRAVVFMEAWQDAHTARQDDAWLLEQCLDPAFFSRMRMHGDPCARAHRNAERSPLLVALRAVAHTAHLCGHRPCMDILIENAQQMDTLATLRSARDARWLCVAALWALLLFVMCHTLWRAVPTPTRRPTSIHHDPPPRPRSRVDCRI